MNKPVSFELAKLLKEKQFGLSDDDYIQLSRWYDSYGNYFENQVFIGRKRNEHPHHLGADTIDDFKSWLSFIDNSLDDLYLSPTIAEVVMWLYEKHGVWVGVQPNEPFTDNDWCFILYRDFQRCEALEGYNSPIEAYEAAIEYTLKHLI